jgi:hypothetical protein
MTRHILCLAAAIGLIGALAVPSQAQFTGYGVGGQLLLLNKSVQQELKLSDAQIAKLKDSVGKVLENNRGELAKMRAAGHDERAKLMSAISEQTNKAVVGVLNPDQVKRLREIDLQERGPMALYDPEVRKSLKITDEQLGKLKNLADDSLQQVQKAYDARDMKKVREVVRSAQQKLADILTDEQKRTWREMLGKPFDLKQED